MPNNIAKFWWNTESSDRELSDLTSSLPEVLNAAYATSTFEKYTRGWQKWLDWSRTKQEIVSIPADPFHVALYLNFVLRSNGKKGSLSEAFHGIRWVHIVPVSHHQLNTLLYKLYLKDARD